MDGADFAAFHFPSFVLVLALFVMQAFVALVCIHVYTSPMRKCQEQTDMRLRTFIKSFWNNQIKIASEELDANMNAIQEQLRSQLASNKCDMLGDDIV